MSGFWLVMGEGKTRALAGSTSFFIAPALRVFSAKQVLQTRLPTFMGLRKKLLLLWFMLLLAPLAILGSIGYIYIDGQLRKDATDYQSDILRAVATTADDYLGSLEGFARRIASQEEVRAYATESEDRAFARQALEAALRSYPFADEFRLVRLDSLQSALVVSRVGHSPLQLDVPQLLASATGRADYVPMEGRGYFVVLASAGANQGLITIAPEMPMARLLASHSDRDARLLLLDPMGQVLSGGEGLDIEWLPAWRELGDAAGEGGKVDSLQVNGKRYILAFQPLSGNLWLASLTDRQILFDRKLPYILIFFAALTFTLLLSGVVFNLIVDRIAIHPVQKLIQATRQIAKGDFTPALDINSNDELGELALSFQQMGQQLHHTNLRIRQLAYFDPLTQLPNRTTLRETLSRVLTRSDTGKWKTAVLFIDLDNFKKVNDRLGHEAGDELLIQISHRLKNCLRQADMLFEQAGIASVEQLISRRGGDEFNAVLTNIKSARDAAIVAERIIHDLNEPFDINKSEIHVGASIGIALFPDDGTDADTLLRNADLAMYEAKAKGKNNYHIFTSAINDQVHQRLALEHSLQTAMVHSQFRLYYQPKVSLADMNPVGFEALIRWRHPENGVILPGKFIPVAEESNLIREIGNWVLAESMQQIQLWDGMLPEHLRIAVNVSARQLAQSDFVDQLCMMMEHFRISPRRLEIELTETSVLQDESIASQHLRDLRRLGVEISLDDFGTGYSSLSFLRKLPIDTVKIDRSFTVNVIRDSEARAIVLSLLGLCKRLQVKTIAEGIETTEQLQFLMEHGCDQGQGFLFSKPLPSHKVLAFLREPSYLASSS